MWCGMFWMRLHKSADWAGRVGWVEEQTWVGRVQTGANRLGTREEVRRTDRTEFRLGGRIDHHKRSRYCHRDQWNRGLSKISSLQKFGFCCCRCHLCGRRRSPCKCSFMSSRQLAFGLSLIDCLLSPWTELFAAMVRLHSDFCRFASRGCQVIACAQLSHSSCVKIPARQEGPSALL